MADKFTCPLTHSDALFLDFDGTLARIVQRPSDVQVDAVTLATIVRLQQYLGGAIAIVTGREIATIDELLKPLILPVGGVHGLEQRSPSGAIWRAEFDARDVELAISKVSHFAASTAGLFAERKSFGVALHYRENPDEGPRCLAFARELAAKLPTLSVQLGKMVVELRPNGADKGDSIRRFLNEPEFRDRRPVFAGDDVTDEDGFRVVNSLGGITIKVGDQPSVASYRCADTESFLSWFNQQGFETELGALT